MKLKHLTSFAVLYAAMLFYASLMPFDFSFGGHIIAQRQAVFWHGWPLNPTARFSGSDVLSNLAIYAPLGWLIATRCQLTRRWISFSVFIPVGICSTLSAFVELAQFAIVSRTPSAADWLLNTISGCGGAVGGVTCGKGIWTSGTRWLQQSWRTQPTKIAALALVSLLAADALAPYLPTIALKEIWRNLEHAHFDMGSGLALHPWHWWLVTRVLVYCSLTILLATGYENSSGVSNWPLGITVAGILALTLEILKPMIVSRTFNLANVATSWLGCIVALLVSGFSPRAMPPRHKMNLAIVGLLAYIFYLAWTPFNFLWGWDNFQHKQPSLVQLLPLYDYALGADLNHARLFAQNVFLPSVLVYLLRVRFGWFERRRTGIFSAALCAGALGFLLELGQMFLPSRTPSMTDVYCFALGAALGARVRRHPAHTFDGELFPKKSLFLA